MNLGGFPIWRLIGFDQIKQNVYKRLMGGTFSGEVQKGRLARYNPWQGDAGPSEDNRWVALGSCPLFRHACSRKGKRLLNPRTARLGGRLSVVICRREEANLATVADGL
jgi:hypothetical protein